MDDLSTPDRLDLPPAVLSATIDEFEDLFFVFDEAGRVRYWNRAVSDITGYSAERLAGMAAEEFVTPAERDRLRGAVDEVTETGATTVETELVTADGEPIPYEFRVVEVGTDTDAPVAFAGIGHDISARRAAEREREALLDRMADAFFATDENWQLTYVNEEAEPILAAAMDADLDREEMVGRQLWEEIPEAVGTTFYEKYHEAMERQEPVTFEEEYPPLDTRFEVRAYPSESGLSVYFRDVTEEHRQREALRERERVLREIYDVTADTDRTFTEQVEALLTIGRETLGTAYGSLSRIEGEEYVFEVVEAPEGTIEAGDVVPLEATNCERTAATERTLVLGDIERDAPELTDKAGFEEWGIACYLGAPVFVDGEVYGTFCFYDEHPRDGFSEWEVTLVDLMSQWVSYELTRKRTRERLERQNEQLDEFASIVSHDLRNPLASLDGWLELAADTGEDEAFERCRRAIDRMETLIDDLLTLARVGERATETEPVDLAALVEDCWTTVPTAEGTLAVETDRTVVADGSRLRQLLENLIRNAVEHGGADVTVTVGDLPGGFYVADDGPGIPEDEREQVFEAGYSTDEEGTGFGLNIVRQVADAHGWEVAVTESAAGGARFEFTGADVERRVD